MFNSSLQARMWESKVIRRMGAVKKQKWLNRTYHLGPVGGNRKGQYCSDDHKKKIGYANKGKRRTEDAKANLRRLYTGTTHSREICEKRKISMIGKNKGKVTVMNVKTRESERIPVSLFESRRDDYVTFNSRAYKVWKSTVGDYDA